MRTAKKFIVLAGRKGHFVCFFFHEVAHFWKHYSKVKQKCSNLRVITAIFEVSKCSGFLWYIQSDGPWQLGYTLLKLKLFPFSRQIVWKK